MFHQFARTRYSSCYYFAWGFIIGIQNDGLQFIVLLRVIYSCTGCAKVLKAE